jgi:apolipoprotein N-acyltransferase
MCGAFDTAEDGASANAVFLAFPDGTLSETVYYKRHLVPFGEYVPMRDLVEVLVPPLADIGMLSDDLAAGKDSAIFDTPLGGIGTLVCFDSIYEALTLSSVRDGAEFLVLPTNDSWFLDSAAAYMHHAQARLRAIEGGRYIVRAADTGISSVIAPDGSVDAELPPLVEGVSISTVHPTSSRTLYSYIGNLFVYLLLAALTVLFFHRVWIKYKEKKENCDEPA